VGEPCRDNLLEEHAALSSSSPLARGELKDTVFTHPRGGGSAPGSPG
jgi:hypothetical protein